MDPIDLPFRFDGTHYDAKLLVIKIGRFIQFDVFAISPPYKDLPSLITYEVYKDNLAPAFSRIEYRAFYDNLGATLLAKCSERNIS